MKLRLGFAFAALLAATACAQQDTDQAAIDAAVEKALAERDREDAAKYRQLQARGDEPAANAASAVEDTAGVVRSAEPLRAGLSKRMGSAYHMCAFTLSIVGEHCGCMVNRATDARITNARQVRLFGGEAGDATPDEIARFTRIVRACSGYDIGIRSERGRAADIADSEDAVQRTASGGRVVTCEFEDERHGYRGRCRFVPGPGGDFQATALEGNYFEDVGRIDLDVTAKNRGQLIINYTTEPVAVAVSRDPSDKACWSNESVRFCAR